MICHMGDKKENINKKILVVYLSKRNSLLASQDSSN